MKSTQAKILRATNQSNSLANEIAAWVATEPITHIGNYSNENKTFTISFDGYKTEPDFVGWGIQTGEIIHNLRSALDNLAYDLAITHQNPPAGETKFPMRDKPHKDFVKWMALYPPAAAALITGMQPYNHPAADWSEDALLALNKMSNADKHRVPQIATLCASQLKFDGTIIVENGELEGDPDVSCWGGPIEKGCNFFEYRAKSPIQKGSRFGFDIEMRVMISIEDKYLPFNALQTMSAGIGLIADAFVDFFPDAKPMMVIKPLPAPASQI